LRIVDPHGGALSVDVRLIDANSEDAVVLLPGLGTPSPDGGVVAGRGQVRMYWSNWCGPAHIGRGLVEIDLPNVGTLAAPFAPASLPRCDDRSGDSVIAVEPVSPEVPDE
jgi:hypothetical protein